MNNAVPQSSSNADADRRSIRPSPRSDSEDEPGRLVQQTHVVLDDFVDNELLTSHAEDPGLGVSR